MRAKALKLFVPVALLSLAASQPISAGATPGSPGSALGPARPQFIAPIVMPGSEEGGNEPSIAIGEDGTRWVSWQSPGEFAKSTDGINFTNIGMPDENAVGDVDNAVDAAGSVYNVQICGDTENILHNCVYRSDDGGQTWAKTQLADNHPGAADRPWIEVYPRRSNGKPWDPNNTIVYLEYHTFSPEELAYVTVSKDGGQTFSEPKIITTDTNALVSSGCNTIPGGVDVDQKTGVVYALWLSGNDVESNAQTGCNYSQIGPFNKAWISVSHDEGTTWEAHLIWTGNFNIVTKVGDNADKIFPALAIDRAGQVHVILPVRRNDDPVGFTVTGEEDPQPTDLILATSPDEGVNWALTTHRSEGSHFFPWIAAGSKGRVAAVIYESHSLRPNHPESEWFIAYYRYTKAVAVVDRDGEGAHFVERPNLLIKLLDRKPIHVGGICTFGVFCAVVPDANRDLLDSISVWIDPGGGANAVWTVDHPDQGATRHVEYVCQSSGMSLYAGKPSLDGCYSGAP